MSNAFEGVHARLLELPVFFLGGMPRSGTTWMQRLLNAHPEVLCIGESRFYQDLLPNIYEVLKGYAQRRHDRVETWGEGVKGPGADHIGPIFKSAFAALAGANLGGKDPARLVAIGEKTPDNLRHLGRLWHLYPQGKFIHVIRDPRDGSVSGYIRFKPRLPEHMTHELYVASYCKQWSERIQLARKHAAGHDMMEVRYEDLHARPAETAAELFRFLGASDNPELVASAVEEVSFEKLSGGRKRGETDANSHYRQGIVGGWQDKLTPRERELAAEIAGPMLDEFGYAR